MLTIGKDIVQEIYEDALAAFRDPGHPCHPFVVWQREFGCPEFQLPEPFSGKESKLGILILGQNPSISKEEIFPTANPQTSFEDFDSFFRSRFDESARDYMGRLVFRKKDGSGGIPHFWRGIERFGRKYLEPRLKRDFLLGSSAIITQPIRFKSTEGWCGYDSQQREEIWRHEIKTTRKMILKTQPKLILTAGQKSLEGILEVFDAPFPGRILEDLYGKVLTLEHRDCGEIQVCPSKHFSRPMNHDQSSRVADAVMKALGK